MSINEAMYQQRILNRAREADDLKAENERLKAEIKKLCGKWEEDERRERKNFHFAQAQDTLAMRNQLAAILNEKGA